MTSSTVARILAAGLNSSDEVITFEIGKSEIICQFPYIEQNL